MARCLSASSSDEWCSDGGSVGCSSSELESKSSMGMRCLALRAFSGLGSEGEDLSTSFIGENTPRLVSLGGSACGGSSYVCWGGLKLSTGAASSIATVGCSGWTMRMDPFDSEAVGGTRLGSEITVLCESAVFGLGPMASL